MRRLALWPLLCLSCLPLAWPREEKVLCGTRPGLWKEELFLHRRALGARRIRKANQPSAAVEVPPAVKDVGNLVVMEDSGGVVARRNDFDLDRKTVAFLPSSAASYRFEVSGSSYEPAAASAGTPIAGLGDDDSRRFALPFAFPFYGTAYREIWVNSDGNLTFTGGDSASMERSLGRLNAGLPRIAPLFEDLDPSAAPEGVRVFAEPGRFVVSWVAVPQFTNTGIGSPQTFQARLYPDGHIELAYNGISTSGAVVGLSPGGLKSEAMLVSFGSDPSGDYPGTVAERFGGTLEVDVTTAAQRFYETHEDAYDYLVFFNNEGVAAGTSAVAFESTVRNNRSGYGDVQVDAGREFGSAARLQAIMNMGPLTQYPNNPDGLVNTRASVGDTPTTVIAHEAGHLFLAYASVHDPDDPAARPMLGYQNAHWYFGFDSEASLIEGNRIQDLGAGVSPRFLTTGTVEGYSPLDQYLMGLRAPEEVRPVFLVTGAPATYAYLPPRKGIAFDGGRRDIRVDEVIGVVGRRTPDYTVAQNRFRFAFILIVPAGATPSADDLAKADSFRRSFEAFYAAATDNHATADTALRRNLRISLFPAAGVLAGSATTATLSVDAAPAVPLTVLLEAKSGFAAMPATVAIPAGTKSVDFPVTGLRAGVENVLATPADSGYHTAAARVQVLPPADASLLVVSGDRQMPDASGTLRDPVVVRLTDVNDLPYPGVRVQAVASAGSTVAPAVAVTDAGGQASFRWTAGPAGSNQLAIGLDGAPATVTVLAGNNVVQASVVVNAASGVARVAPDSLASIYGRNLAAGAAVTVLLNGSPAPVLYAGDGLVNFLVPQNTPVGAATVVVSNALGDSAPVSVPVDAAAPGIFLDGGGPFGAIFIAGTGRNTTVQPAQARDLLQVYCTGLGQAATVQARVAEIPATVVLSGMTDSEGLYLVTVQVPDGVPSGAQPLVLTVGSIRSNAAKVNIE